MHAQSFTLHLNIGDEVVVGQLVAKLDQSDFLARVKAAEVELAKNTANFRRAQDLVAQDFISKTEYDKLEAAKEVSDSALLVARKALSDSVLKAPSTASSPICMWGTSRRCGRRPQWPVSWEIHVSSLSSTSPSI